jgi:hypothetical protein
VLKKTAAEEKKIDEVENSSSRSEKKKAVDKAN